MKKIKNLLGIIICLMFVAPYSYAQETQEQYKERTKEMLQVEAKIAIYTAKHINDDIPKEELNRFNKSLISYERDDHGHELTRIDKGQMLVEFKKNYWRILYFEQHPTARASYSTRVAAGSCANGNFETGDFANYSGETSNNYRRGDCNILTGAPPAVATVLSFTPTALTTPRFTIMNVGSDPNVATLPQVWSGNHSARINDLTGGFRGDKLIKRVVLSQANERIFFNYALVLHDPGSGHANQKPTFLARVLDNSGIESDRVCNAAYTADPFLFTAGPGKVYKPWACDNVQASGSIGDTVTLEFVVTDCGQSAHGGYAYIDDICDNCTAIPDTCNFQGSIELNPTDTCVGDRMQVCGTYNLAALNCTTALADEIRLYIYKNGVQVGGVVATNTSPSGGTFCFTVNPSDFPVGATGGYDFYVEMDFDLGASGTTIQNDYHSNPGLNNDYIFGAQCCPEFKLQTCCDLISNNRSASATIDPAIKRIIDQYQQAMQSKYRSSSVDCCSPCNNPTDSFPVFVTDLNNNLINPTLYTITWSHDASNNNNHAFIFPNQQTIVTVSGPDSCVWSDTFLLTCCVDTISITPFCTWNPCDYPNLPVPLNVQDANGNLLGSGYSMVWSNGFTTNSTSSLLSNLPISVIVYDSTTGCTYYDTFDIPCPTSCFPVVPSRLGCNVSKSGIQTLTWAATVGLTYEVEIIYNDPFCVRGGTGTTPVSFFVSGGSYTVNVSPITGCLSWRVRSICPDGTVSAWTAKQCCCKIVSSCNPVIPTKLGCNVSKSGIQTLTWSAIAGLTYQVEIIYNDPFCVKGGTASAPVIFNVSGGSYTVNVSPKSGCLSWRVRSICPNGARSAWTAKQCCCKPIIVSSCRPVIPTNLKCISSSFGQTLTWDNIIGRTYEVEIMYGTYDPLYKCCKPPKFSPLPTIVSSNTNSIFMNTSKCFTWRVRSVCKDGTKSGWSGRKCSCYKSIIISPTPTRGSTNILVDPNGKVSNEQDINVLVSPNPVTDVTVFDIKTIGNKQELGMLFVANLTGEVVYNSQVKLNGKSVIDLSELSSGTYIYKVISDGKFKSGRIVITN